GVRVNQRAQPHKQRQVQSKRRRDDRIVNSLLAVPADGLILNAHRGSSAFQWIPGFEGGCGFLASRPATKATGSAMARTSQTLRCNVRNGWVILRSESSESAESATAQPRREK